MMDPFSVTVGAAEITANCISATVTIIKFVGDLRTVDVRIRGFYDEIIAFQATYEGLEKSLSSPILLEAARVASKTQDGGHLWNQMRVALDDSLRTINRINKVLDGISKKSGFGRKVKTVLDENLKDGELQRLRQRVQFFNATISLPIQMMGLMLQLEQRGMTAEHQQMLETKFMSLERTMRQLITDPHQVSMISGSTLRVGTADEFPELHGKETYLSFAKKILSSASAAASTRSSLSTIPPPIDPPPLLELEGTTQFPDRRRTVPDWIAQGDKSSRNLPDMNRTPSLNSVPPDMPRGPNKSTEIAYKLAQRHLELGQEKAGKDDESAEKSFTKALQLLEKHDFGSRIAFQPAEVVLMLAQSCLMQKHYDKAIELLDPVAERQANIFPKTGSTGQPTSQPQQVDKLQALAASHMLGKIYMAKGDFDSAKDNALTAFTERMDELGEHDEMTLESVRLLIDIYRAMGDEEEADAYGVFLTPPPTKQISSHVPSRESHDMVSGDEEFPIFPSISPPPSEIIPPSPSRDRKVSRPSFTSRLMNKARPSQPALVQPTSHPEPQRKSFSRSTTLEQGSQEVNWPARHLSAHMSSPSDTSHERTNSLVDDDSTTPSSSHLERTASSKLVEPHFQAVEQLCHTGDFGKAVKIGLKFLQGYHSNHYIIREQELEKNIRKGKGRGLGLASTGEGYSPLHYFCDLKDEYCDEVALILKYGADPNAHCFRAGYTSADKGIITPLGLAISRGHTQIAQLLLHSKDIRTDAKDTDGFTPLLAAARRRQYSTVQLLLNHAPQSIPKEYPSNWYGISPLHDAAKQCDLTLVNMYLAHRHLDPDTFNINLQDKFGKTALMHAIIKTDVNKPSERVRMTRERKKVVEVLIEAGADEQLLDDKGNSARWFAEREQGDDVIWLKERVGEARFEMMG